MVASATSTIYVKASNVGNGVTKNVLIIGDSTTDSGFVVERLLANFKNDVMKINSIGTRSTMVRYLDSEPYSTVKHEGRSGWTARQYVTIATDQANIVNAFWNPATNKFDFGNYISVNTLPTPDYTIINLGINDTFSFEDDQSLLTEINLLTSRINEMIASIKAYNPTIKIGIALTIPPSASQDSFALSYGVGQTRYRYKRNNMLWVQKQIDAYRNREGENIYLIFRRYI